MEDNTLAKVLVVDDEPNIVELLTVSLKFQNFEVYSANSGNEALRIAREVNPDAYILDVMMPGMDGFELLGKLRQEGLDGPVLYLTAKDGVDQRIHGLTIGADDYVTKPFSLEEVITRLRVIMRRGGAAEESTNDATMSYADLTLNDDTHEVTKAGELIELSPTEFNLLRYLMQNKEVVLSKSKILDNVWHYDFGGDGNVVESYISYLRRKIDTGDTQLIHTVRGVGYVLRTPRS
ncbi:MULTISPECIES: response regulator transcription factor [Corynebacterium]|uniref:Response regulator transcription factor n=1 Tax=Corynebacterium tuberculostearicum TaxID=38304 RepID=A0AAE4NK52_9CORY|nr:MULTISPECIES: response regulator transcription factor [Corynebacterium]MCT1427754.1 response regulator transcription factor [Corynebacterium sp. p3-SID1241]MDV2419218.1 response regulator transcription factor [Corynebacterium tuberculostearicum]MDV2433148.1 response regulator transcription factor [Corynebacterium tuberculostearicum]WKE57271.1 response regulator transcription factor [Corynebacterium tuberculostearicum]WKE58774.1 response regulator transcription factor [Corynebacterium tuberc